MKKSVSPKSKVSPALKSKKPKVFTYKRAYGGYTKNHIWVNPDIKGADRKRVTKHEKLELKFRKEGMSYHQAHNKATILELKGMTEKEKARYRYRLFKSTGK